MKTALLTSLTAKVAAGVAGVALLSGGTATALVLQPAGDRTLPASAAEAALEATGREAATTTTTTTSTTVAPAITTVPEDDAKDEVAKDATDDTESKEHPDNFGAVVSEDAKDGGVDGQEISELAKARNEERRADRADEDEDEDETSPADAHRKNDGKGKPADD